MPIQLWTRDQRPELMLAGGDALARGIAGGVGNLSKALEDIAKKKKDEASLANVLRKKHSLLQQDRKDEFATMSLDELRGEDEAFTLSSVMAREEQAARHRAAQIDLMMRKAAMEEGQARGGAMALGRLGQMGQDPASIPGPLSNEEFDRRTRQPNLSDVMRELGAAGEATGAGVNMSQIDDLSRALAMDSRGAGGGPLTFEEDPATGARFARGGNTILPSGTNPAKMNTGGQEIYDADGNLLGHNVPTGGGKFAFRPLRPKVNGQLEKVLDPMTGEPVPGMGMDATGEVHDFRDEMTKKGIGKFFNKPGAATSTPTRRRWNPKTKTLEPVE